MSEPVHAPVAGAETLAEPLRSRWSPSFFDADAVLGRAEVETLLRAAQWAPSQGNSQPWVFLVAERGTATHDVLVAHLSRGNSWVPRASLVLLSATQVARDPEVEPDGKAPRDPAYAHHDLGQAAAHVTLQARTMGLEAHQFSGFDQAAVAAALGVPDHVRLLSAIAIGRRGAFADSPQDVRDREARERSRKPLDEVGLVRWGQAW